MSSHRRRSSSEEDGYYNRRKRRRRSSRDSRDCKRRDRSSSSGSSSDRYRYGRSRNRRSSSREDRYSHKKGDGWLNHVWGDGAWPEPAPRSGYSYKQQSPNATVIFQGLLRSTDEEDIRRVLEDLGKFPKAIRLIRTNDISRGYAFADFDGVDEARSFMECCDGEITLNGRKVVVQYSTQKDQDKECGDWFCKCGALNFKQRDACYKCRVSRRKGERKEGKHDAFPSTTIWIKGLSTCTTEASVLKAIQMVCSLPLRSIKVCRDKNDPSTNTCFLEMNNLSHSVSMCKTLQSEKFTVDSCVPKVTFGESSSNEAPVLVPKVVNAAIEAAQWSHKSDEGGVEGTLEHYSLEDVPRLAEYSSSLYAKTPEQHAEYLKHYTEYYMKMLSTQETLPQNSDTAPSPSLTKNSEIPTGLGDQKYPVPNTATYQFDETSGYYYDPVTKLYYDAKTQYYLNAENNRFLYWDGEKETYLLASVNGSEMTENKEKEKASPGVDNGDKVKVAKRIAKDMEKWAKSLNHKKEMSKQHEPQHQQQQTHHQQRNTAAVDVGFSLLNRGSSSGSTPNLVAEYGEGSESDNADSEELRQQDDQHVDWKIMACLLCKRQFPSKENLMKHQQMSNLHKENLEKYYKACGSSKEDASLKSGQYRDRAKERRIKYNEPESVSKKNYSKKNRPVSPVPFESAKEKIGGNNVGNKMLQKMGWQEGMGLGKRNQGRTDIVQAEGRIATAGLGTRSHGVTPGPGESYKDCVKKMMKHRYEEIDYKE